MIQFVDLARQAKTIKTPLTTAINKVINDAAFIDGPFVKAFERDFAALCKKKYCIGLNSGTDALQLALLAYDIKPGDEVITTPYTYFSTAMVISNIGAKPVFVDIDPESFTIDVKKIERAITKKTRAIIPVHLYGQSADMDAILALAKKYSLIIIEDCCQAVNAQYKGKVVPVTETGAFSFYPGKNLGAYGDGGALVTDNPRVAERMLYLRNDGSTKKYVHQMFGAKSRLDGIQAAILSVKLPHLNKWTEKRRNWARVYTKQLEGVKQVQTPKVMPWAKHVFHCYVIVCQRRDALRKFLESKGITTVIHYPIPVHLQKPYRAIGFKPAMFPVTEDRCKRILSLPMFPELTQKEVEYVASTVRRFYSS